MADDGMLMNFDIGNSEPLLAKTTFKGGRWKDRQAARRYSRRQQGGTTASDNANHTPVAERKIFDRNTYDDSKEEYIGEKAARPAYDSRAPKRQRVDSDKNFKPLGNRSAMTAAVVSGKLPAGSIQIGRRRDGGAGGAHGKPLQVISSLFTFNPSTKTVFDDPEPEAEPAKPSKGNK